MTRLLLAPIAVFTLALVIACGDDDGDGGATTAPAAETSAPAATTPSDEVTRENTLIIATPELFLSRDPLVGGTTTSSEINLQIYETPIFWIFEGESVEGGSGLVQQGDQWEPKLAESVDISDDGLVYTFHLREGITFYPSGNEMTAADWEYVFQRALGSPAGFGGYMASQIGFTQPGRIIDDYTYELTLDKPNPNFHYMAVINSAIIDSAVAKENATAEDEWSTEWLNENTAGTGPYYLKSSGESEIVLEANPDYWGDSPYFKRIVYRYVPDLADRVLLLKSGEVDIAYRLSPLEIQDVETEDDIQVLSAPSHQIDVLFMNVTAGPTQDQNVRKAILAALPYDDIIDSVFFGKARAYNGIFFDEAPGFLAGPEPVQDLAAAQAFMDQSTYPDGFDVDMLIRSDSPTNETEALLIKDALANVGINVNIVPLASGDYSAGAAEYSLIIRTNHAWLSNGIHIGGSYILPTSFFNYSRVAIDEMTTLFGQAFTTDEEAEYAAYEEMQELYYAQDPIGILARFNQTWAMSADIQDFTIHELLQPIWAMSSRTQ